MGGKQSHLKASSPLVTPNDQILLLQLPKELRLHCLSFMSERDLRTLASTCVRLQKIVSEYLSNPKYFPLIFGSVSSLAYPLSASMSKSLREPYNEVLSASRTADDFLWSIGTILYPHQKSISITLHEALPLFSVAYKVAFAHLLGRKRETLTYRCLEEESAISAESWSDLQQLALFIPLFDQVCIHSLSKRLSLFDFRFGFSSSASPLTFSVSSLVPFVYSFLHSVLGYGRFGWKMSAFVSFR